MNVIHLIFNLIKFLYSHNKKMAAIDGKLIANMLYHAGVETVLTIGYAEIGKKY